MAEALTKTDEDGCRTPVSITQSVLLTEETIQTEAMKKVGIVVNTATHVVICLGCRVAIRPTSLSSHIARVHSLPVDHSFCESLVEKYKLHKEPGRPGKVVQAIYGLDVFPDYLSCDNCGAAFLTRVSITRHHKEAPDCQYAGHMKRFAQSYNPGSGRMFFGVTVPEPSPIDLGPDPVSLIKNSFSPTSFQALPIQAIGFRDSNHFLAVENWADHVDGLTGEEIQHIVREREPELRERVRGIVLGYANDAVQALGNEQHAVKVAIGDYNG